MFHALMLCLAAQAPVLDRLKSEAAALEPLAKTPLSKSFLSAVPRLPAPGKRTVFQDTGTKKYFAGQDEQSSRKAIELDDRFYYDTKYGSPLAYVRAMELLGEAGLGSFRGRKFLDFGYGGIGHLRLIAENGGSAVGVDIDSLLRALYSKLGDTGRVAGRGEIRLVEGFFPSDAEVVREIGAGYDVFLSKNTLKRGYVHPEREVDKRLLVDLGVSDAEYLKAVHALLKPGGLFLIYNLSPAQNPPDQPFLPWADGRCPFGEKALESAGFEMLAFDRDDGAKARRMASLLGWNQGPNPMDLEKDLFAHYTLARRRK
jgi:SAM-dependent methyltransferase